MGGVRRRVGALDGPLAGFYAGEGAEGPQDDDRKKHHGESGGVDIFANGIELSIAEMKHQAVSVDLRPHVQRVNDERMLVLHAEIVAVGEPITDDDFRLFIMRSAVPGCFSKGHDFLTALKGVPNRHERKGTVIGEQGAKVLIVIARDYLQVCLNECLIRLTDHFFLHRFSCFLCSLSQWGSSFLSLVSSASSSFRSTIIPWTINATIYSRPRAIASAEDTSSPCLTIRYRSSAPTS